MNVHFTTNLDEAQRVVHALNLSWDSDTIPPIGSRFQLSIRDNLYCELEVHSITFRPDGDECRIELHIPSWYRGSVLDWDKWQKNLRKGYV